MTIGQLVEFIVFIIAFCTLSVFVGIGIAKIIIFVTKWIIKKINTPKYGVYVHYQPNPIGRNTLDCSIRAISKIFDISWYDALDLIVEWAKKYSEQTNCSKNLNTLLYEKQGMHVYEPKKSITFEKFAHLHPVGTFALNSDGHICACIDGKLYDSWDSSLNKIIFYSAKPDESLKDPDITFDGGQHKNVSFGYGD